MIKYWSMVKIKKQTSNIYMNKVLNKYNKVTHTCLFKYSSFLNHGIKQRIKNLKIVILYFLKNKIYYYYLIYIFIKPI